MLKYFSTLLVCTIMATSVYSFETKSQVLDAHGKLILLKAEDVSLKMAPQCKSYRISKNPPLVPRLKCRVS